MSKRERKNRALEDMGSINVSINVEGEDCWKVGCH
jgi:hypothetical protein